MYGFESVILGTGAWINQHILGFYKGQKYPPHLARPHMKDIWDALQRNSAIQYQPVDGYDWVLIEECRAKGLPYPYVDGTASQKTALQNALQSTETTPQVVVDPPLEGETVEAPKKRGRPKAVNDV